MSIIRKVKAVERLFYRLDEEIKVLQQHTGLHCLPGCGRCCTKPDIEASPLEFLPLAFEWFKNGLAYQHLEKLQQETSPICVSFSPLSTSEKDSGSCGVYSHRGLICRLFAYSASRDKWGTLRFVSCKPIKEDQPNAIIEANALLTQNDYVPVISDFYKHLAQIDLKLGNQILPINKAIQTALEEILHYYAYRPFPRPKAS